MTADSVSPHHESVKDDALDPRVKTCSTCNIRKDIECYEWTGKARTKRRRQCRDCTRARWRRYYEKNREQLIDYQKCYYVEHKQKRIAYANNYYHSNKERIISQRAEYRQRNQRKIAAAKADYWTRNRDKMLKKGAAWRRANPHKVREINTLMRATRKGAGETGKIPAGWVDHLGRMQGWKCAVCRQDIRSRFHVDHIKPLAKGGRHEKRNLQLLCVKDNLQKSARDPIDFMQSRGFLL